MIYFDTSYIVKSYLVEHGTHEVRELIADHDTVASSIHGRAEFVTAVHRHLREQRTQHTNAERSSTALRLTASPGFGAGCQSQTLS